MEHIRSHTRNGVGVITLDRPPANTFDYQDLQLFGRVIDQLRYDRDVKAIAVVSASEKFFSAGADVKEFRSATPRQRAMTSLLGHEIFTKLENTPLLVVAALTGHTVGGGLELALACDLRFAVDGDYKIGLTETELGLVPGMGGTQRLPRLIGYSSAVDMIVRAEVVNAKQAAELGIVDRLSGTKEECDDAVLEYCARIVEGPDDAIGHVKLAARQGLSATLPGGLAFERMAVSRAFATPEAAEGIAAFTERRRPDFSGH